MKKQLLYIFLIVWCAFSMKAADVSYYFERMPDEILLLSSSARLDLMDFYKDGISSSVKGPFDNVMEIKSMSEDYLLLQISANSSWQIKVLPLNDSLEVLAVVQTVSAPAKSSSMTFYTSSWQSVSEAFSLPCPQCGDFWRLDAIDSMSVEISLSALCSPNYYEYCLYPGNDFMEIRSSAPDVLSREVYEKLKPFFIESFRCVWNRKGFARQ